MPAKKPEDTTETTLIYTKPKTSKSSLVTPTDIMAEPRNHAIQSGVEADFKPKSKPKIARKADKNKARREKEDSGDYTDPTLYYSIEPEDSMFGNDNSPQQKTVPPPLLDPHYELELPIGFQDRETQERLQRQLELTPSPPLKQPR